MTIEDLIDSMLDEEDDINHRWDGKSWQPIRGTSVPRRGLDTHRMRERIADKAFTAGLNHRPSYKRMIKVPLDARKGYSMAAK